jgi:hypothetical protein
MVVYFVWEENGNQKRRKRRADENATWETWAPEAGTTWFSGLLHWIFKTTLLESALEITIASTTTTASNSTALLN